MTPEQEKFLCEFADKELARIAEDERSRVDVEKAREIERVKEAYVLQLRALKDAEVAQAIATFDALPVEEKLTSADVLRTPLDSITK